MLLDLEAGVSVEKDYTEHMVKKGLKKVKRDKTKIAGNIASAHHAHTKARFPVVKEPQNMEFSSIVAEQPITTFQ